MQNAKKTTISYCATVGGTYTAIGKLMGEIPLPSEEWDVGKPLTNAASAPELIVDAVPNVGDVEVVVAYDSYATQAALRAQAGTPQYFMFTLANGNYYVYYGAIRKLAPVDGADEKAAVGKIGFAFAYLAASGSET
jgi:hypothetical protein